MLLLSYNCKANKSKSLLIHHLQLDGTRKSKTDQNLTISNSTIPTMPPLSVPIALPLQESSLESLLLEDDNVLMDHTTMEIAPLKIEITPAPPLYRKKTFSWDDFPLLTEDCVYVDSCWQKRKAAIAQTELTTTGSRTREKTRPLHAKSRHTARSKTAVPRKSRISNKTVRFDAVHIREHSITIGDHDWCEGTLAITLDWPHAAVRSMFVSDYESLRERQGRVPRGRLPKLDHEQRKQLLKRVGGISDEDLQFMEYLESGRNESATQKKIAGLPRVMTIPNLPAAVEDVDEISS
jgi:hypothetical protein